MSFIFQELETYGHEQVVFVRDEPSKLQAIIGIHSTVLGPALGGCRMWNYRNEEEAFRDVLRLSRGMTYKAAVTGLNLGGGKAVILGDARKDKSPSLLKAFGRAVEQLGGRYITAEDVGMTEKDIDTIRTQTKYAVGGGQEGGSGDPSNMTAFGVFQGMKAAVAFAGISDSLQNIKIAIQGAGNVGYNLAGFLSAAGAKLVVADIYESQVARVVEEFGAEVVSADEIYKVDCDIFAPCALGAILNARTIPQLKCKIVAGAANNQLDTDNDGLELMRRGILYVPDFAINAGGVINVGAELDGFNKEKVLEQVSKIHGTINNILSLARDMNILPQAAAMQIAEDRLKSRRDLGSALK